MTRLSVRSPKGAERGSDKSAANRQAVIQSKAASVSNIPSTFVSVHHVRQVLISETRKTGTVRNRTHVCPHVHVVGGMSRRRIMGHLDAPTMGGGWRPRRSEEGRVGTGCVSMGRFQW